MRRRREIEKKDEIYNFKVVERTPAAGLQKRRLGFNLFFFFCCLRKKLFHEGIAYVASHLGPVRHSLAAT